MEPEVIRICEINSDRRSTFSIRIKVIRMWTQKGYGFDKHNLINELIIVDEQGDRIGLSIMSKLRGRFVKQLKEDGNYIIKNVSVGQNKYNKTIHWDHENKLACTFGTSIKPLTEWNGQPSQFTFVDFNDIVSKVIDYGVSVDVIGKLVGIGNVTPWKKDKVESKYIAATLKDISGTELYCTLWGDFADNLNDYVDNKMRKGVGVIVIIQFGKTKEYSAADLNTVTTDWKCTQVFINSEDHVTADFRSRYTSAVGDEDNVVQHATMTPSGPSQGSINWFDMCTVTGLSQLDPTKVGLYVAYATIKGIIPDEDWCYIACNKCNRKVFPDDDLDELTLDTDGILARRYKCVKCVPNPAKVLFRFKVQIRVVNTTGSASLWMFDTDVQKIINYSPYQLKKTMKHEDDYPAELNKMVGKEMLFKFEIRDYNMQKGYEVYTVKEATTDEQILSEFLEKCRIDEEDHDAAIDCALDKTLDTGLNSATGENSASVDFNGIPSDSPAKKRTKTPSETTPKSVSSSSTKAKKPLAINLG